MGDKIQCVPLLSRSTPYSPLLTPDLPAPTTTKLPTYLGQWSVPITNIPEPTTCPGRSETHMEVTNNFCQWFHQSNRGRTFLLLLGFCITGSEDLLLQKAYRIRPLGTCKVSGVSKLILLLLIFMPYHNMTFPCIIQEHKFGSPLGKHIFGSNSVRSFGALVLAY